MTDDNSMTGMCPSCWHPTLPSGQQRYTVDFSCRHCGITTSVPKDNTLETYLTTGK